MFSYIVKRLLVTVPTVLGVSIVVFALIHIIPGDPVATMLGIEADQATIDQARRELGLDRPLLEQYLRWFGNVLRGDLGRSIQGNQSVFLLVLEKLPATLELSFAALIFSLAIALPAGILSAVYKDSWIDYLSTLVALFGVSVPGFWLGLILIYIFSLKLGFVPPGGYSPFWENQGMNLRYLLLPAISLGSGLAGIVARMVRATMLDVLNNDYIRVARAKGLAETVVVTKHALKNTLIPTITIVGLQLGVLLGGAVVIETVFAWPGVGKLTVDAILGRDFPVVQGAIFLIAVALVLVNLLVDIAYAIADPRIRY